MTARRWAALAAVSVAVLLLVGRAVASLYVDYRWYEALGAAELWRARTLTQLLLGALSTIVGTVVLWRFLRQFRSGDAVPNRSDR